jgi:hypothetical protein
MKEQKNLQIKIDDDDQNNNKNNRLFNDVRESTKIYQIHSQL